MKKSLKGLLVLICLFPILISAATFKPTMSCPSTANPGETVSCKITATIDDTITGVQGKFNLGGTTYVSFTKNTKVNYYVGDADGFSIGEMDGIKAKINSTSLTIGTLKVKIPSNNLTAFSIQVTDLSAAVKDSDNGVNASNLVQTIRIKSNDSSLKSLSVEGMTLGPNFSPTLLEYSLIETNASSIKINAEANHSGAKISGAGTVSLNYGDNTKSVTVTSESGSKTVYKIKVRRTDIRDTVNTLSALGVKGYNISPAFNPSTKTYSLTVDNSVSTVDVTASLTSSKSSFVKGAGPRSVSLNYGGNAVNVKVKAENEKVNTYTINITRKDNRDGNNYLSRLSLSDGNITFDKNTTEYTVNVSNTLKQITVSAIAESDKAKVKGSGTVELAEGTNEIRIDVTAENGAVRSYIITVNRGEVVIPDEPPIVDNKDLLKSLIIKNADFTFVPEVTVYEIKLKEKDTSLDIQYKVKDGCSGMLVGNENLKDGSVVTLTVQGSDSKIEYTFNIKKDESSGISTNDLIFYVAIGFLGLVVLGIVLSMLTKKKPTPEEVVQNKFVQENPKKFYNTPTYINGGSNVSGSMVRQIEHPNSLSDIPNIKQPEPVHIEEPNQVSFIEPLPVEEPGPIGEPGPIEEPSMIDMEPSPIEEPAPIETFEVEPQPDFEPIETVSFDEPSTTDTFEMTELSEPTVTDVPEFVPLTEEDYNKNDLSQ